MATYTTCFVRANYPDVETRAQNMLEMLEPFAPFAVVWDRDGKNRTHPENWHVLNQKSGFGLAMLKNLPAWWLFVWRELRREKPKVVHACNFESAVPAYVYCVFFTCDFVYDIWDTAGGMYGPTMPALSKFLNVIERFLIRRANLVLVPDKERLEQLGMRKAPTHVAIAHNSLVHSNTTTTKTVDFSHRPLTLLYSGTMAKHVRGLEMLISAAKNIPGLRLIIGGYGADEAYIESLCTEAASPQIEFLGKVTRPEVKKLTAEADFIVTLLDPTFPNYRYATSTKVFEAFAGMKPVITTEGTASGNLVSESQWGFVIPFEQVALNNLLNSLLSGSVGSLTLDPQRVEKYDWKQIETKLRSAYKKLLE